MKVVCAAQAALLAAGCTSVDIDVLCATPPLTVKRSVAHLSVARRDIGTVAVGGKAYFAGGCVLAISPDTGIIVDSRFSSSLFTRALCP